MIKYIKALGVILAWAAIINVSNAQSYELDASHLRQDKIKAIDMQAINSAGISLSVNNRYFEKNGKPWFPLMGEMHYNRVPPQDWEEGILKMKNAGLSIVATYVFWNEQEPSPGVWDWKGNRDIRSFIELCKKHNMYVWLRIGPWSHGEQKNGGFPDWIQAMKGTRHNTPAYLDSAKKLDIQIGEQTKGLYFKDGGPVIGVQLENEYASGEPGHISKLKEMALSAGIKPVFWSVTANTVFDENKMEVIPLQGSYSYRGWEKAGGGPTTDFLYGDDQWIMTDALGKVFYDVNRFPRGLCEQGTGSQMTYNNRFVVDPKVIEAHVQNQIGRGMNMIGYYMFHGGTQTPGLKEPGLPESYDFQAPIGEFGIIRQSYKDLKILHQFVNSFGNELVQMQTVEPAHPVRNVYDTTDLRYVARVKDNSGFLFLCNTQVRLSMPDKQVTMRIKLKNETITFPAFTLKGQTTLILPFNQSINGILIKYATAQPLATIRDAGTTTLFMIKPEDVDPSVQVEIKKNTPVTYALKLNEPLVVKGADKKKLIIILLSRKDAENSWITTINGKQAMVITSADVIVDRNRMQLQQTNGPRFNFKVYPQKVAVFSSRQKRLFSKPSGLYDEYSVVYPISNLLVKTQINIKEATITLPSSLPKNIGDILLRIKYLGGACTVSQGGRLLTDNLFNGTPWLLGTKNYLGNKPLQLNIQDWTDNITGIDEQMMNKIKTEGSKFISIEAVPLYKLNILGKK